jgi:AAA domain
MDSNETGSCLLAYTKAIENPDCQTNKGLDIPKRTDGSEYSIGDLADDQKQALAVAVDHLKKYCKCDLQNENTTMRLTVSGVAGSGKSTWINTYVSLVRRLFNNNDTVGVYGPTGSAAFNAGGETINRGFGIPIPATNKDISGSKHIRLLKKFAQTIAIIIDERSMIEADKLGLVKYYMEECAHGGCTNKDWGGIPNVILVGDDYQLPAIGPGAFNAIGNKEETAKTGSKTKSDAQISLRLEGYDEFKAIAKNTVYLESVKRVNKDQEQLRRILQALRGEETNDSLSDEDMQRLQQLNLKDDRYSPKEREEIQATSMYLFATKEPRDDLNRKMLLKANRQGNPVARMKSRTEDKHGKRVANNAHYDAERCPIEIRLCKTAKVALNGQNISPALGLYHGSLGTVEDIVYHPGERPEHGDLPAYVLVNFSQYCGKQLVPHSKQSVPIPPMEQRCRHNCCTRLCIPLILAYGKTIHTFQGQTVGPATPGRPENPIKRIIVEPGTRTFEGNNVGLFYTAMSRATTIGNPDDKMSSAIYFDGPNFSKQRVTSLTRQQNGAMYHKAYLRQRWVKFMKENNENRKRYTKDEMEQLFEWITEKRFNNETLMKTIKRNDKERSKTKENTQQKTKNQP